MYTMWLHLTVFRFIPYMSYIDVVNWFCMLINIEVLHYDLYHIEVLHYDLYHIEVLHYDLYHIEVLHYDINHFIIKCL